MQKIFIKKDFISGIAITLLAVLISYWFVFEFNKDKMQISKEIPVSNTILEVSTSGDKIKEIIGYKDPVYYNVDKEGNIYVTDRGLYSFFVYDADKNLKFTFQDNFRKDIGRIFKLAEDNYQFIFEDNHSEIIKTNKFGELLEPKIFFDNTKHLIPVDNDYIAIVNNAVINRITKDKQFLWQINSDICKSPTMIKSQPNKNYLASCDNSIIEFDRDGNIIKTNQLPYKPKVALTTVDQSTIIVDTENKKVNFYNNEFNIINEIKNFDITNIFYSPEVNKVYLIGKKSF